MKLARKVAGIIVFAILVVELFALASSSDFSVAAATTTGTFGSTTINSNVIGTGGVPAKTASYYQLTTTATVSKITAYIRGYGMAKAAIYSDLNGQPNQPIGGTTYQNYVPATDSWVDFPYATPVTLQPGNYWLTLIYDSGANWHYANGGISAWKSVTFTDEPATPFGNHNDRADAISIYATYTTQTTTGMTTSIPSSSQSIKTGGIAGYMTWNGVFMDPQAFSFAQTHFDTMSLGSYQWQNYPTTAIQQFKNAGMTALGYKRFAEIEYIPNNPVYSSSDWVEVNKHEDWFIHDAITGSRIWDPTVNSFLMDIGNANYRQHWLTFVANNLNTYQGFTGLFLDNTIGQMNANWKPWVRYNDGSTPTFKTSDLNNWHTNAVNFLAQIKATFPTKTIIINTDGFNYDYVNQVDGIMIEGFIHAPWQNANDYTSSSGAKMQIDYYSAITNNGKIAWYCSGASSGTTTQINNLVKYSLAGALISNNNPQSVFSFNNWFSFDNSYGYYPIMDNANIGNPTGAYYQSQGIYMRNYQNGLVLFNPSGYSYTINLGAAYKVNGTPVTSIALGPFSGEILKN